MIINRAKIKALHDFCKKNIYKPKTKTISLGEGIKIIVKYETFISCGAVDCHITDTELKLTGPALAFVKAFGFEESDYEELTDRIFLDEYLELEKLDEEYLRLYKLTELDEVYSYIFEDGAGTTLQDIMDSLKEELSEDEELPEIELTREYTAILDKKNGVVNVGCQTIPIEKIREIIKKYDSIS